MARPRIETRLTPEQLAELRERACSLHETPDELHLWLTCVGVDVARSSLFRAVQRIRAAAGIRPGDRPTTPPPSPELKAERTRQYAKALAERIERERAGKLAPGVTSDPA